jgi:hypothetical protein
MEGRREAGDRGDPEYYIKSSFERHRRRRQARKRSLPLSACLNVRELKKLLPFRCLYGGLVPVLY